ncbi:MAG: cytochrome ubiquinol oxidase subunit I, partial [Nitrospirales bacterium]
MAVLLGFLLVGVAGAHAQVAAPPATAFPYLQHRSAVWIAAQLHSLLAGLVLGTLIIAVAVEWGGRRKENPWYDRLARELAQVAMMANIMGALSGGFFLFLLVGSYPGFATSLVSQFFPVFAGVYPLLFVVFTVALVFYLYSWDRFTHESKGRHIAIGVLLIMIGAVILGVIEGPHSFMNTPGKALSGGTLEDVLGGTTLWARMANESWLPFSLHQFVSSLMLGGFIGGLIAVYGSLGAGSQEGGAYYGWKGFVGSLIGLAGLMLVPLTGYYAVMHLCHYDDAICRYMEERLSMYLYLQGCVVGFMFLGGNMYLWLRLKRVD